MDSARCSARVLLGALLVVGCVSIPGPARAAEPESPPPGIPKVEWSPVEPQSASSLTKPFRLRFAQGTWVAPSLLGPGGAGAGNMMTSPDGVHWTVRATPAGSSGGFYDAIYLSKHRRWLACGESPALTFVRSEDGGATWAACAQDAPLPEGGVVDHFAYSESLDRVVAVGRNISFRSDDGGLHWTALDTGEAEGYIRNAVAYGNGVFVAGGDLTLKVGVSPDGIRWTLVDIPELWAGVGDILFREGMFVMAGLCGDQMLYSRDGREWKLGTTDFAFQGGNVQTVQLGYGGGTWFCSGEGGVVVSRDGIHWNKLGGTPPGGIYGIEYGQGKFVVSAGSAHTAPWMGHAPRLLPR